MRAKKFIVAAILALTAILGCRKQEVEPLPLPVVLDQAEAPTAPSGRMEPVAPAAPAVEVVDPASLVRGFLRGLTSGRVDPSLLDPVAGVEVTEWDDQGDAPEQTAQRQVDAGGLQTWLVGLRRDQDSLQRDGSSVHPTATGIVADEVGACSGGCCQVTGTMRGWASFLVAQVCTSVSPQHGRRVSTLRLTKGGHI